MAPGQLEKLQGAAVGAGSWKKAPAPGENCRTTKRSWEAVGGGGLQKVQGKPENREMDSRKSQEKQLVAGQQESRERQQKVTGKRQ